MNPTKYTKAITSASFLCFLLSVLVCAMWFNEREDLNQVVQKITEITERFTHIAKLHHAILTLMDQSVLYTLIAIITSI